MNEHAAPEFLAGLRLLGADETRIPVLEEASGRLQRLTGFEVIGVPGLIPEADFFAHLAERRFPVTVWMRRRDELDYLVEPDLFHDFFGHLPMLAHTVFANFIQAYGALGARARGPAQLKMLARLYWYTVEFGLVVTSRGLRAYGAGILSSSGETVYATRATGPARIGFDLQRVLRTNYLIDAYQKTYFVLDDIEQLFESVLAADFDALFAQADSLTSYEPDARLPTDKPLASINAF
jgi:phenylalanine-4-hydroxylase